MNNGTAARLRYGDSSNARQLKVGDSVLVEYRKQSDRRRKYKVRGVVVGTDNTGLAIRPRVPIPHTDSSEIKIEWDQIRFWSE